MDAKTRVWGAQPQWLSQALSLRPMSQTMGVLPVVIKTSLFPLILLCPSCLTYSPEAGGPISR